jgi:deoxycytidylate deaminase
LEKVIYQAVTFSYTKKVMSNKSKSAAHASVLSELAAASSEVAKELLTAKKLFRKSQPMSTTFSILRTIPEFLHVFPGEYESEFARFYVEIEKVVRDEILNGTHIHSQLEHLRLNIDDYAMLLAIAAAARCEDPKRKVGACALDSENRVLATSYNGLPRGWNFPLSWWDDDKNRRQSVIHAESNLCSLTIRGKAKTVAVTTMPCGPCARDLIAHGVTRVVYGGAYPTDPSGQEIFDLYGVETIFVSMKDIAAQFANFIKTFTHES